MFISLAVPDLSYSLQILNYSMWDLGPRPGIDPRYPTLGAWNLSHWTAREVPRSNSFFKMVSQYSVAWPFHNLLVHIAIVGLPR